MAPKQRRQQQTVDDNQLEEDSSSSGSSSSDSDEDQVPQDPNVQKDPQQSSDDSDDDDTQNTASAYIIQPITRNPVSTESHAKKRPGDQTDKKDDLNKKIKISGGDNGEIEGKKSITRRVFTENDEVVLLNKILDFKLEKGMEPNSNMTSFHEFVKGSLSFDAAKTQVYEKIRRLKLKFQKYIEKMKKNHELLSPHLRELFHLSQKIWGSVVKQCDIKMDGDVVGNTINAHLKVEVVDDDVMEDKEEEHDVWLLYPGLCASIESEAYTYLTIMPRDSKKFTRDIVSKLGKDKAKELEDGWKSLTVKHYELHAMRMQCIRNQTQVVSDVIKR